MRKLENLEPRRQSEQSLSVWGLQHALFTEMASQETLEDPNRRQAVQVFNLLEVIFSPRQLHQASLSTRSSSWGRTSATWWSMSIRTWSPTRLCRWSIRIRTWNPSRWNMRWAPNIQLYLCEVKSILFSMQLSYKFS